MNIGESAELLRRVQEQGERIKALEQRLAYLEREIEQHQPAPANKRLNGTR